MIKKKTLNILGIFTASLLASTFVALSISSCTTINNNQSNNNNNGNIGGDTIIPDDSNDSDEDSDSSDGSNSDSSGSKPDDGSNSGGSSDSDNSDSSNGSNSGGSSDSDNSGSNDGSNSDSSGSKPDDGSNSGGSSSGGGTTPSLPTEEELYNTQTVPTALKLDYSSDNSLVSDIPDIDFLYYEKITNRHNRTINKEFYTTELEEQYGKNVIRYPAYDYNYEEGENMFPVINGAFVNIMNLVYNERTTLNNGTRVKYSDTEFINEQIAANTLKAHPASSVWYKQKITDETQAVTKQFKISTVKTGAISLGLYAPAGEIITLQFDDDTFELIKESNYSGVEIVINDNYWDNYEYGNTGQISNRYPFVQTTFSINPNNKTLQFGTPFGGSITLRINSSLKDNNSNYISKASSSIGFSIDNAIECLNYVHGFTTESDWNQQVDKLKSGEITAPIFSATYSWATMNVPFTDTNTIAGKHIDTITYPYEVFKKWNSLNFLSNYVSATDLKSSGYIMQLKFCDDIWGSAAAWGGGGKVYAPVNWAGSAFLSGLEGFSISSSWGLMHEINHSHQQNLALFKKRGHGETNQVTAVELTLLSDTGRYRNPNNIYNEYVSSESTWTTLSNSYSNIYKILNKSIDEYPVYAALIFTLGGRNYIDYIRQDMLNNPNTADNWTSLNEIKDLSDYFQIDFWPAFENIYPKWNDNWPSSYNSASQSEKETIDSLKKYSAMDFLGNLYASGSYLYNNTTKQYTYTGDVTSAYEVPAGMDYVFDFEKFINSANTNFNWNSISVEAKSKNGVTLVKSGKSVTYKASEYFSSNIDEFDITITPGEWEGKPENYVPGYKWKIKVRQVVNSGILSLYNGLEGFSTNFTNINHLSEIKKYQSTLNLVTYDYSKGGLYSQSGNNKLYRAQFKFIAPESGTYKFNSTWSEKIAIYINGNNVYKNEESANTSTTIYTSSLTKGEVLDFDAFIFSSEEDGNFNIDAVVNDKSIDVLSNSLIPAIDTINSIASTNYSYNDYLTNEIFKYKLRYISYLQYKQTNNYGGLVNVDYGTIPSKSIYTLSSSNSRIDELYNQNTNLEIWDGSNAPSLEFEVNFINPTKVASLYFLHRTDNHTSARPSYIKVIGYDQNGNELSLYEGNYGTQFNDRDAVESHLNLNSINVLKSLKVSLRNDNYTGLILKQFAISNTKWMELDNNISIRDNYIAKTPDWKILNNSSNTYNLISAYDGHSLVSNKKYDAIDLKLKNASGFNLIGTLLKGQSTKIDIYINNKIYQRDLVLTSSNEDQYNINLFKYLPDDAKLGELRVTIVHKDGNPLIINYIQTYGSNVYTTPIKN